jgi:hypothetical protein
MPNGLGGFGGIDRQAGDVAVQVGQILGADGGDVLVGHHGMVIGTSCTSCLRDCAVTTTD